MTAVYRGETVRLIRVVGTRAWVVWHGMVKRVNAAELEVAHVAQ